MNSYELRDNVDTALNNWLLSIGYTEEEIAQLDYSFIEDEVNAQLLTIGLKGLNNEQ